MGKLGYIYYGVFSFCTNKLTLRFLQPQHHYPKPDGFFILAHKNIHYSMESFIITYSI